MPGDFSVELRMLLLGSGKADSRSLDLADRALPFGFGDAGGEMVADLLPAGALAESGRSIGQRTQACTWSSRCRMPGRRCPPGACGARSARTALAPLARAAHPDLGAVDDAGLAEVVNDLGQGSQPHVGLERQR
jgi:hypothetical protein